jgi:hypothetical protein
MAFLAQAVFPLATEISIVHKGAAFGQGAVRQLCLPRIP